MLSLPFSLLFLLSLLLLLLHPSTILPLPDPDPASVQPFKPTPSPPITITIPAFPEQSDIANGCPLNLPSELFHGVKSACSRPPGLLHKTRCCPVLASWLYYAYSVTALGGAGRRVVNSEGYDMPLLPDDTETCVDEINRALRDKGVELVKVNESCDVVYCYCGIRLHHLSCNGAFYVNEKGNVVGDERVLRLERDCVAGNGDVNRFPGLGGCSKCLNALYKLNYKKNSNSSKETEDSRTAKMRNKDCQLMGLTWLLAKNRKAYFHTVSSVLRAMMMSTDGSSPQSCTLNSDGKPLAVDSSEISSNSSSITRQRSFYISIVFIFCLLNLLLPMSYL